MTKIIYQYDKHNFYTKKSRMIEKNEEIPDNYTDIHMPDGLLHAKLTDGMWIEGATDAQKQQIRAKTAKYIEDAQKNSLDYIQDDLYAKIDILTKRVAKIEDLVDKLQSQ